MYGESMRECAPLTVHVCEYMHRQRCACPTQTKEGMYVNDSKEKRRNPAIRTVLAISTYVSANNSRSVLKSGTIVVGSADVKCA